MAQYIGNRFERMPFGNHTRRKRVAESVGSFAGHINTSGTDMTPHDHGKRIGPRQGMIRSLAGQKDLGKRTTRTRILEVIKQAFTDLSCQG